MSNAIPEQICRLLEFPAERSSAGETMRIDGYEWSVSTDPSDGDFVIIAVGVRLPLSLKEWFVLLLTPMSTGMGDHLCCDMDPILRKARLNVRIREDNEEPSKVQAAEAVYARAQTLLRLAHHGELGHERLLLRRHARISYDIIECLNSAPDPGEPASKEDLLRLTNRLMAAIPGRRVTELCLPMFAAGMIDPVVLADIEHLLDLQTDTLRYGGGTATTLPVQEISDKKAEEDGGTWLHRRATTQEEIHRFWRYHDPLVHVPALRGDVNHPSTPATNEDPRNDQSPTSIGLPIGDHSTDDSTSPRSTGSDLHLKPRSSAKFPITFSNRLPRF